MVGAVHYPLLRLCQTANLSSSRLASESRKDPYPIAVHELSKGLHFQLNAINVRAADKAARGWQYVTATSPSTHRLPENSTTPLQHVIKCMKTNIRDTKRTTCEAATKQGAQSRARGISSARVSKSTIRPRHLKPTISLSHEPIGFRDPSVLPYKVSTECAT